MALSLDNDGGWADRAKQLTLYLDAHVSQSVQIIKFLQCSTYSHDLYSFIKYSARKVSESKIRFRSVVSDYHIILW